MAGIPSRKTLAEVQSLPSYSSALPGISELLNKMVAKGDAKGRTSERTAFDGSKPAPVSIQDYLIRLCKYGYCSNEVFIFLLIYLGRLRAKTSTVFTSYNIHRLLLTSFVVAAKLRDDTYYSNKYYASIGGVTLHDMNRMEQAFLRYTQWELHVIPGEFDQYNTAMHQQQGLPEGSPRGSTGSRGKEIISSSSVDNFGSPRRTESYGATDYPRQPLKHQVDPLSQSARNLSSTINKPLNFSASAVYSTRK
ncbi:Cyclin-U4-1 [Diplonema papillatum]|nr:Cyclin-U4-1 [Diplonema papillatum]